MKKRDLVAGAMIASFFGFISAAAAAPILTIDNPNQSVVRPASGNVFLTFNGSYTLDPGNTATVQQLFFPFLADQTTGLQGQILSGFTTTYTGPLFRILIQSTATLGLYDETFQSSVAPSFAVIETDGLTVSENYSVNVLDKASPVPEPMTLTLFGAGLVGAGAFRRRNKAKA